MNNSIINKVNSFKENIARLKKLSPIYPEVYEEEFTHLKPALYNLSTIVIFEHRGIKYKRHCVQFGIVTSDGIKMHCKNRLENDVWQTIRRGVPDIDDEIVKDSN